MSADDPQAVLLREQLVSFSSAVLALASKLPIDVVFVMRHRDEGEGSHAVISFAANVPKRQAEALIGMAVLATATSDPDHFEELHRLQ